MNYKDTYTASTENPEAFWKDQADAIRWFTKPESILSSDENGYPLWYKDGELNVCYLALDKHIEEGFGGDVMTFEFNGNEYSSKIVFGSKPG